MSDYWLREEGKQGRLNIATRDSHDRLRMDIEKVLCSYQKLSVLKPCKDEKHEQGRRGASIGQKKSKVRGYGLSLDIGLGKEHLINKPKFVGCSSTKSRLTVDPSFKGTLKKRKVQTPAMKASDRTNPNQDNLFSPKTDEYKAKSRNLQKSKLKRRYNHSISGVNNYKLDIDAHHANDDLKYHLSYAGMPKTSPSLIGIASIGSNRKTEGQKLTLKTKEESQSQREQISKLIKNRLDSNKDKLLKHEDNQSYIKRVKQMLKSHNMPCAPMKASSNTPLSKKIGFSSIVQPSANDQDSKYGLGHHISETLQKAKFIRSKNKSLDTRESKSKGQSHIRNESMKRSGDFIEKELTERQSSKDKRGLLKSFLEIVKQSPPEKHITPKYAHRSARTASFHGWQISAADEKKDVLRMNSLKQNGTNKAGKKSHSPAKSTLKIDTNFRKVIPKTAKGKATPNSLIFKTLSEKAKTQTSARDLQKQGPGENFETLFRRPLSNENARPVHFKSPSTGESPAKIKVQRAPQFEAKQPRVPRKAKNFHSFSSQTDSLLMVDFKRAVAANMVAGNQDSVPVFFELLKSVRNTDLTSEGFTLRAERCLMTVQASNLHTLEVHSFSPGSLDRSGGNFNRQQAIKTAAVVDGLHA